MTPSNAPKILVVGDQTRATAALCEALKRRNYRCTHCVGGADAYVQLRRERFDVLVANVDLPQISGFDLLDIASALRDGPKVILTSQWSDAERVRHAFQRGAFDFVLKPSEPEETCLSVENALARTETKNPKSDQACVAPITLEGQRDPKTGLLTRRAFADRLAEIRNACRHQDHRVAVTVFDVHPSKTRAKNRTQSAQDDVVSRFVHALTKIGSPSDPLVRYDANRFILAQCNSSERRATRLVEQIERAIVGESETPGNGDGRLSLSVGIAESQPGFVESHEDLVERAVAAAASAAEPGRKQIVCWSQLQDAGPSHLKLENATIHQVSGWINRSRQQLKRGYLESTLALVAAVEAKEPHARGHARAVSYYCEKIARRMGLSPQEIESLNTAALLHDIGKIGVPDAILQKAGPLTAGERRCIQKHPATALDILANASFLRDELPIILHHHEKFDGTGYPHRIAAEAIPLGARILNVCDSLDAMLSTRRYKRGFTIDRVKAELSRCAGRQFDPQIVKTTLDWIESSPEEVIESDVQTQSLRA